MHVRRATPADATLALLLRAYPAESLPDHVGTPADVLQRHGLSGASGLRVLLAEARGTAVRFGLASGP